MPLPADLALFIVGMHRSGTSALSGGLQFLGFEHGERRMAPQPDNPKGFWEPRLIARLNEDLLLRAGGSWCDIPDTVLFSDHLISKESKSKARAVWAETFGATAGPVVCKEPRLAFFVDLWRAVAEAAGRTPKFLFAVRDVRHVARSLNHRNGIPIERGAALWAEYNFAILRSLPAEVPIIAFDRLLSDPARALSDAGLPEPHGNALSDLRGFLGGKLESEPDETPPNVPEFILALNTKLRTLSRTPTASDIADELQSLKTALRQQRPRRSDKNQL